MRSEWDRLIRRLREARPGLRIVKSLVVRSGNGDELADEMGRLAPWVDAFITDTYDPTTGASGATGVVGVVGVVPAVNETVAVALMVFLPAVVVFCEPSTGSIM